MATQTTKTCDRCGDEIKYNVFPFAKLRKLTARTIGGHGDYDYCDATYDLCKNCIRIFDEWIKAYDRKRI